MKKVLEIIKENYPMATIVTEVKEREAKIQKLQDSVNEKETEVENLKTLQNEKATLESQLEEKEKRMARIIESEEIVFAGIFPSSALKFVQSVKSNS